MTVQEKLVPHYHLLDHPLFGLKPWVGLVASFLVAASTVVVDAAEFHIDTFQSGTLLGWTGGGLVTQVADGGPEGAGDAFLQVVPFTNLAVHNSLPIWTGDFTSLGALSISADLRNAPGSDPLAMRVVLFGPDTTNNRWTSSVAVDVPADGVWRNYSFSLAEDDVTRVLGNSAYADMMADVVRVMLRHDPGTPDFGGTPVSATLGIDNIELVGPTEPVPGDYSGDSTVDLADFDAWVEAYGTVGESPADGNGDGVVGAADYVFWRNLYESSGTGQSAQLRLVPEPAAAWLLLIGGILTASRRARAAPLNR